MLNAETWKEVDCAWLVWLSWSRKKEKWCW